MKTSEKNKRIKNQHKGAHYQYKKIWEKPNLRNIDIKETSGGDLELSTEISLWIFPISHS